MKHRAITTAAIAAGVLAVAGCGSAAKQSAAGATDMTTAPAASSPASSAAEAPSPTPTSAPAHSTARSTTPATPTARKSPTAPHATSPAPTANPPAGTPWAWSPNTPPSCTPKTAPKPGAFIQSILVRSPVDNSHPWNGWVGDDNACFAYAVGLTDANAKTIQLLVMDTDTRAQKAFTGHLGDTVGVGRFTVKIAPSSGFYGPTLFEPGFYWN